MAALTDDQLKVKALLAESVMYLCMNGLKYSSELRIEGLIGITVDNNQIVLVNINEAVKSASTDINCSEVKSTRVKRKSRKALEAQDDLVFELKKLAKANVVKYSKRLPSNKKPVCGDRLSAAELSSSQYNSSNVLTAEEQCTSSSFPKQSKKAKISAVESNAESDQSLDMAVEDELLGDPNKCVKVKVETDSSDVNDEEADEQVSKLCRSVIAKEDQTLDEANAEGECSTWLVEQSDESVLSEVMPLLQMKNWSAAGDGKEGRVSGLINPYLKSYTCPHCGLIVRTSVTLRDHMAGKHGDAPRFICYFCGKRFKWRSTFFYHRMSCNPAQQ